MYIYIIYAYIYIYIYTHIYIYFFLGKSLFITFIFIERLMCTSIFFMFVDKKRNNSISNFKVLSTIFFNRDKKNIKNSLLSRNNLI